MIPQVSQITERARFHIGDTQKPGGQTFTDSFLFPFYASAYEALYRYLEINRSKILHKTGFFNVPPYTGQLDPKSLGIQNMGQPLRIFVRNMTSRFLGSVTAINASSPAQGTIPSVSLNVNGHGRSTGDSVVTFGFFNSDTTQITPSITDDVNGEFIVVAVDGNNINLQGCDAQEINNQTAAGTLGQVSVGSTPWPVIPINNYRGPLIGLTTQSAQISIWNYENGYLFFNPCTMYQQIKMEYALSAAPPMDGSVGIDDCLDALALFTAGAASASKGAMGRAQSLFMRALGNGGGDTSNIVGGAFLDLCKIRTRDLNVNPIRIQRFRPKRNTGFRRGAFL